MDPGYNPEHAKFAILGVAALAGTFALLSALKEARQHERIEFNPFKGDVLPVSAPRAATNVTFMCLGIYLGVLGIKEAMTGAGYTQAQVADIIPHGFVAAGVLSLVHVAMQTRK
jgi:hypothetical protein